MESQNAVPATNRRRGFTLVELLVVISIIAVLIGLSIPALSRVRQQARVSSTQTLMNSINAGVAQYQTDKRRLPGVFSAEEIGSTDNFTGGWRNRPGVTSMENALIDLAGGAFSTVQEIEDAGFSPNSALRITLGGRTIYVIPELIGSLRETGYVDLDAETLVAVEGQNSDLEDTGLPDVLDAFGTPIMMWAQSERAGRNAAYVREYAETDERALFYWASNASYAMSGFPRGVSGTPTAPPTGISQYRRSLLSSFVIGSERDRLLSVMALTGNRSTPTTSDMLANPNGLNSTNMIVPAQPRGEVMFVSAGPDRIFLNGFKTSNTTPDAQSAVYTPTGDFGQYQIPATGLPIERFDEVLLGGS